MKPTIWSALRDTVSPFWDERDAREKKMIVLTGIFLGLVLIYLLLINPALNGRKQLQKTLPGLREQAAELQMLSKQAMDLHNAGSGAAATDVPTEESIGNSLVHAGLKPRSINQTDDGIKVVLPGTSFSAVVAWLEDMQQSGLATADAQFEALPDADKVNATFTLRAPHAGAAQE